VVDHSHIQLMRQPLSHVLGLEMDAQLLSRMVCYWSHTRRMSGDKMELLRGSAVPQGLQETFL
jgi:hypothetical protein